MDAYDFIVADVTVQTLLFSCALENVFLAIAPSLRLK